MDRGQPEMRLEGRERLGGGGRQQPCSELLHQLRNLRRIGKRHGRAGDTARIAAVDSSNARLASRDDPPMQLAHRILADETALRRQLAHPEQGLVMVKVNSTS
jgi:hypothetical protein